jgi:hypothetical protein
MLEPTLVLTGERANPKKKAEGGRFGVGKRLGEWLGGAVIFCLTFILAASTHGRVGVRLHVGAPGWYPAYELSKNLHRLASSGAVRFVPICIVAPHLGQRQVATVLASGHGC